MPSVPSMTWQSAKAVGDKWVAENLPPDLRGKVVILPEFPDNATALFFDPGRTLNYHQMVTTAIAREARKRGAQDARVMLTCEMFYAWLNEHTCTIWVPGDDMMVGPQARATFIALHYKVQDAE